MTDVSAPPQLAMMVGYTFNEFCETTAHKKLLQCRYQEANIRADVQLYLSEFPDWLNWVLIVEEDLPDTLVLTPLIQRLAEHSPRSSIYLARAEDDLSLLDSTLEQIDLSEEDLLEAELPMLLFFNEEWQYLSQWGPRPQATEPYLDNWMEAHPEFEALALSDEDADQEMHTELLNALTYEMRVWYLSELDHKCCEEIQTVLESIVVELDEEMAEAEDEFVDPASEDLRPTVGFEQDNFDSKSVGSTEIDQADSKSGDGSLEKQPEKSHNEDTATDKVETDSSASKTADDAAPKKSSNKPNNKRTGKRSSNRRRGNSRRRSRSDSA